LGNPGKSLVIGPNYKIPTLKGPKVILLPQKLGKWKNNGRFFLDLQKILIFKRISGENLKESK